VFRFGSFAIVARYIRYKHKKYIDQHIHEVGDDKYNKS